MAEIAVVDFACLQSRRIDECESLEVNNLVDQVYQAFTTVGFLYIKNHGIPNDKVLHLFNVAKRFFLLPSKEKEKFSAVLTKDNNYHGWLAPGRQIVDPNELYELKEAYHIVEPYNENVSWPMDGSGGEFQEIVKDFYERCENLSHAILQLISYGLNIQDKNFFTKAHGKLSARTNNTSMRLLYYPFNDDLKSGDVRLGSHTDYGTITLLFQDQVGGLEVYSQNNGFVSAKPIEGAVLVNIGDLLQRWTNDKLMSTKHRVVVPDEEIKRLCSRQSIAFFVFPDNSTVIKCFDGSSNYAEVTAKDYLNKKLSETLVY
ncbi:proline hydroxylase buaE-like isoform X1 [Xenia sp. Carnegie-2017]|uniref:proline hydroxylase buaE-like isoform X1 n=1 Tax=Xenia sp. Carnegie-2017 TaxID=2897299 RepID=UPI001F048B8E|nr:proline hydroxylase buaE-like isoform X1 [Xenia sp. Carnegie-2017]